MTIRIDSMAHGGDGVGRLSGKAVFVTGAIPGDLVTVDIVEAHDRYDKAVLAELIKPAPGRVTPVCPHFASCGGCQWQMATYGRQLEWKRQILRSQLEHIVCKYTERGDFFGKLLGLDRHLSVILKELHIAGF